MARLAAAGSLVLLAGCAAGNCDPSQAGFLSGIGCETSGAYTTRNQAQQASLGQARQYLRQESMNAGQAQSEAVSAQMSLNERRRRLGALDRETATMRARLNRLRASNGADQGRLEAAQMQLDDLQRQRSALPAAPTDAQMRDLEQKRATLLGVVTGL